MRRMVRCSHAEKCNPPVKCEHRVEHKEPTVRKASPCTSSGLCNWIDKDVFMTVCCVPRIDPKEGI